MEAYMMCHFIARRSKSFIFALQHHSEWVQEVTAASAVPNSVLESHNTHQVEQVKLKGDGRWPDIIFILLCGLEVFLISAKNLSKSSSLKRSPSWHTDTNKQLATECSPNALTLWFYLLLVEHKHRYSLFFFQREIKQFMVETRWERTEWHVWSTTETRPH